MSADDEIARIRSRHSAQVQRLESYTEHESMLIENIGTLLAANAKLLAVAKAAKALLSAPYYSPSERRTLRDALADAAPLLEETP